MTKKEMIKALKKFSSKRSKLLVIAAAILFIVSVLYLSKSLFLAAVVNYKPIWRFTVDRELEKQGGKQIIGSMVDKILIAQEAKRLGIVVSQKQIDDEIKNLEDSLKKQNLTLDDALKMEGLTKTALVDQIKLQKMVEAILSSKINITDEDIKKNFEENKSSFGKSAKFDEVKNQVKSQILQERLSTEYQKWIAALRAKAKIYYF